MEFELLLQVQNIIKILFWLNNNRKSGKVKNQWKFSSSSLELCTIRCIRYQQNEPYQFQYKIFTSCHINFQILYKQIYIAGTQTLPFLLCHCQQLNYLFFMLVLCFLRVNFCASFPCLFVFWVWNMYIFDQCPPNWWRPHFPLKRALNYLACWWRDPLRLTYNHDADNIQTRIWSLRRSIWPGQA